MSLIRLQVNKKPKKSKRNLKNNYSKKKFREKNKTK